MLKDHPVIERMERTGSLYKGDTTLRFDDNGQIMEKGDPALKMSVDGKEKIFVEKHLKLETILILEECGAEMIEIK